MATVVGNRAKTEILKKNIDLVNDTIKIMLVTASYTPSGAHNFINTASAFELAGTGYTGGFAGSGRKTLANKAVTQDDSGNRAVWTADDPLWTSINAGTAKWAIVYKPNTADADSIQIAALDIAATTTNGADFTVDLKAFADGGIFYI